MVGVNSHVATVEKPIEILRVSHEVEVEQVRSLGERRSARDQAAVDSAMSALLTAARSGQNMIPPMIDAALAEATLGEICDALKAEWGSYFESPAF
jgi:methylmalonyl-CoA mutase N-terminal domain/subunit